MCAARSLPHASASVSRRQLLSAAVAVLAGCDAGAPPARTPPRSTPPAPSGAARSALGSAGSSAAPTASESAAPALEVVRLGPLGEAEKGGLLVVLLHGWRARGDDLVPLAQELARPGQRFLVPAAPLAEPNGGRAWWRLDGGNRPAHAYRDELPEGHQPNPQLRDARRAVQSLLRDAQQRYAPDAIALAGFSQGAMLALDVALAAAPPVARVAVLSGTLLVDSLPALRAKRQPLPSVFIAHGRDDGVLPFAAGAAIPQLLAAHGHAPRFLPFDGGHQIPPAVVSELRAFLSVDPR